MAKRLFDLVVSSLFMLIFSPFYLLIALLIKWDSSGPVHYRGRRVGRSGKLFEIYKFRTMITDANMQGPRITRDNDPRVTRVGGILRKSKLDEIPQLWNVVRGEMSIIGPRPEDPLYVRYYTVEQARVLAVRPGLSSLASIKYRHEENILAQAGDNVEEFYVNYVLPDKLRLDLEYVDHQSFWRDAIICFQTVWILFRQQKHMKSQNFELLVKSK